MIFWFRTDLRIHDNPALDYALSKGVTQAVYLIPVKQWQQHDVAPMQADFILRHVALLQVQLKVLGIELVIEEVDDFEDQISWLENYCRSANCHEVIANSELAINEINRDKKLQTLGINLSLFESDVIVSKGKVLNNTGEMYKVFTPFKRAWLAAVKSSGFSYLDKRQVTQYQADNSVDLFSVEIEQNLEKIDCSFPRISSEKWPLITCLEQQVIPKFLSGTIDDYHQQRDIPSIKGTSGFSPYLAIGALSPRYLLTLLLNKFPELLQQTPEGAFCWLNELIWREFYRNLLWHFPQLAKGKCFNEKYANLPWPNNQSFYQKWQQGKTGYPIVDAAMRQLAQTGWMHNRLRMIVASFLTKHLLIDWRLGERHFIRHLIDGDLAANNGGWQWAAGTGCDAQPYFRVFNPITQSEKFDPDGSFIRKYLPELSEVPLKYLHFPHQYIADHNLSIYWPAIVEHKSARLQALDFYKVKQ